MRDNKRPLTARLTLRATSATAALALVGALVASLGAPGASTALATEGGAAGAETNGIIVTLESSQAGGVSLLSGASDALDEAGLEVSEAISEGDGELVVAAQPAEGQSDEDALEAALALDGVSSAQLNYVYDLIEPVISEPLVASDPTLELLSAKSSGILADDPFAQEASPSVAPNQYWLYAAGLTDAWELSQANGSVTIVTIDSGAMLDHEDLAANLIVDLAYDTYRDQTLSKTAEQIGTSDPSGHGTHVAGIAAAVTNNGVGIAGASYNAKLLPISVVYPSGSGYSTDTGNMLEGLEYVFALIDSGALENVRVVNLSLGGYGSDNNDAALHEAIAKARNEYGIAVVCAGGNGKEGYTGTPLYPSDYEECISVTALTTSGENISGFDYNESKDISAPGASIWSTYTTFSSRANGYYSGSLTGTSMASPMVAGTVALMFAARPLAAVDDVCEALYATATEVDNTGVTTGSHGALNAAGALEYLTALLPATDVARADWYYESVSYAMGNGIMNGYEDGTGMFGPNDTLTREQAACVLYNLLGNGASAPSCEKVDVSQSAYYTTAVNWCVANGIMGGYSDGSNRFGVGEVLTRQELASVLANICRDKGEAVDTTAFEALADHGDTSAWATDNMQWAVYKKLLNGSTTEDGSRILRPLAATTRAEMAAIIMNARETAGVL